MNCIIIDDEDSARAVIRQLCSKIPNLDVIAEFSNALDAIKFLNKDMVDIIFLDLHMPDFTGADFIQTLKHEPKIVLTTSDTKFAIEAYQYDTIVDYLVKPISFERFEKSIRKIEKIMNNSSPKPEMEPSTPIEGELFINIDRRLIKLKYDDIMLVEARGDYIEVKTTKENYIVHSTLKKMNEKLPDSIFLKVHRAYVINLSKIIDIEDNSVLIEKNVIPISRANRPELMRRLNLL